MTPEDLMASQTPQLNHELVDEYLPDLNFDDLFRDPDFFTANRQKDLLDVVEDYLKKVAELEDEVNPKDEDFKLFGARSIGLCILNSKEEKAKQLALLRLALYQRGKLLEALYYLEGDKFKDDDSVTMDSLETVLAHFPESIKAQYKQLVCDQDIVIDPKTGVFLFPSKMHPSTNQDAFYRSGNLTVLLDGVSLSYTNKCIGTVTKILAQRIGKSIEAFLSEFTQEEFDQKPIEEIKQLLGRKINMVLYDAAKQLVFDPEIRGVCTTVTISYTFSHISKNYVLSCSCGDSQVSILKPGLKPGLNPDLTPGKGEVSFLNPLFPLCKELPPLDPLNQVFRYPELMFRQLPLSDLASSQQLTDENFIPTFLDLANITRYRSLTHNERDMSNPGWATLLGRSLDPSTFNRYFPEQEYGECPLREPVTFYLPMFNLFEHQAGDMGTVCTDGFWDNTNTQNLGYNSLFDFSDELLDIFLGLTNAKKPQIDWVKLGIYTALCGKKPDDIGMVLQTPLSQTE